jgi:hypothetical protein
MKYLLTFIAGLLILAAYSSKHTSFHVPGACPAFLSEVANAAVGGVFHEKRPVAIAATGPQQPN